MRRFVEPVHVGAFLTFFAAVMAVGLVLKDAATQASVQEVRAAVQRGASYDAATAAHTRLDDATLPRWDQTGWRLTGGRTDLLEDNRDALTGFYRRGESTIAYTVIGGGTDLQDVEDCTEGCGSAPLRPVLSVEREVDGHTVVLTGWPVTDDLYDAMENLVLASDA